MTPDSDDVPAISPAAVARAARLVVANAQDSAEAAVLLDMLGLGPAASRRRSPRTPRHLRLVPAA